MNRRWLWLSLLFLVAAVAGGIYLNRGLFGRANGPEQPSADGQVQPYRSISSSAHLPTSNQNSSTAVAQSNINVAAARIDTGSNSPRPEDTVDPRLSAMYDTPIAFYGKVIDESGRPISGAKAMLSVLDKPWENGSRVEVISREDGLFSLTGVRGAGLTVNVVKDNYYTLPRAKLFSYGVPRGVGDPELPTSSNPAVFVLKAKGKAEPLVHIRRQSFRIAKDGTPFDIVLAPASERSPNYLRVETLTQDTTKNDKGRYDWRCRLTLGGGGLVPRLNEFDFMAPANGYQESLEVVMLANDPNWRGAFQQEYFAKLANGCYARLYFDVATRGSHSCVIEAFINPMLGSRNLEYDPALVEIK